MKTISTIQQNTEEWHKMRNNYIGASEANIIMETSRHKTPLELFNQKTGKPSKKEKKNNFVQNKGHNVEAKIRNYIELSYDNEFPPIVAVSDVYDFLMASLDGYCSELGINWECKYVGQEKFEEVQSTGLCIEEYYPQVQQQLLVTGASYCLFTVVTDDKSNPAFPYRYDTIEVHPNFEYMENELLPKLKEFWQRVQEKNAPDLNKNDVLDMSDNEQLVALLGEYAIAKRQAENEKELKKKIVEICGHNKVVCNGVKITEVVKAGKKTIDYKKFVEDSKYTIPDSYIKNGKSSKEIRIAFPKEDGNE